MYADPPQGICGPSSHNWDVRLGALGTDRYAVEMKVKDVEEDIEAMIE